MIASTRSGGGLLPSEFTEYPRKVISCTPNSHFVGFIDAVIIVAVEQKFQRFAMLTFVVRCYEEIIDVRVDEIEPACDFVDESPTCLRGVPKPKHHVCCFEKT